MATLLVQSCSKSKNQPATTVPALELYSGYFFKIIKKSIREGGFSNSIDICILSAEHGLIGSDTEIGEYDRRMDASRATELAPDIQDDLKERVNGTYDRVIVNAGEVYRQALNGIEATLDADVHYIEGEGIGAKGHILKSVVRGDLTAITEQPATIGSRN